MATPYPVLRKRRSTTQADQPPEQSSILRDAGAAAMTGLHTVGSLLSAPSRALWGTANALSGHEAGFGNLNPLDSTGGIELSQFLTNQGVLPKNDETKWEAMDFARPLIDIAGDPTSYLGFGALTKAGQAASKADRLTRGVLPQIAAGERALVGLQVPFSSKAVGLLGTGPEAARVARGVSNVGTAIKNINIPGTQAKPLRWLESKFRWSLRGMRQPETQALAPQYSESLLNGRRGNAEFLQGVARKWQEAGQTSPQMIASMGMALEQGLTAEILDEATGVARVVTAADGPDFWNYLDPTGGLGEINSILRQRLDALDAKGIGRGDLNDAVKAILPEDGPAAVAHAAAFVGRSIDQDAAEKLAEDLSSRLESAPITSRYLPRHMRAATREALDRGVYTSGPEATSAKIASDLGRQEMLKGIRGSRWMVDAIATDADADRLIREIAAEADGPEQATIRQLIEEARANGADPEDIADLQGQLIDRNVAIGRVAGLLEQKYGNYVEPMFKDIRQGGIERPRLRAIAEWMINHPEIRQLGVFGTDVMGDVWRYLDNTLAAENNFDFVADVVQRHGQLGRAIDRPDVSDPQFEKVGALFGAMGLNVDKASGHLSARLGITPGEVKDMTIPKHIADDLRQFRDAFHPATEQDVGRSGFQKFMSLWKAGALSWPRRIIRDVMSGAWRNMEQGLLTGKAFLDADHLWHGRTLRGYSGLPAVQNWLTENGLEVTDENATEAVRRMLGSYMAQSPGIFTDVADLAEAGGHAGMESGVDYLLRQIPGAFPSAGEGAAVRQGLSDLGTGWGDPLGIPGVRNIPEATFGPVKVAQRASEFTDYMNRASNFLEQIRQGEADLPTIFDRIDRMQVSYDPRRRSPADHIARKLLPFWTFMSRQIPYTLSDLAMNPGGRLATTVKAVDRQQGPSPTVPDAALSGTSIPLGGSPDGTQAFLTGLGLMHEQSGELLGQAASGDLRGIGYNLLGASNPLIQKPAEYVTGQSFFREGERLSDLDPTLGRLLSNVGESTGLRSPEAGPVAFPGSQAADFILSGTPFLGPLAGQLRTAADPRRNAAEKALQLGTGVRVLKQSPESQRKVLRRRLDALAESEGARVGEHGPYASEAAIAANPRLGEILAVRRQLDREAAAARKSKSKRKPLRRKAGQPSPSRQ